MLERFGRKAIGVDYLMVSARIFGGSTTWGHDHDFSYDTGISWFQEGNGLTVK